MITLHHLDQSRSFRVVWLLEELGLSYNLVCHWRGGDMRAPAEMKAVQPLGKSPIVCDDHTLLFESGAILEYIVHRYGEGRLFVPSHHMDYATYLVWLHAAEGTCMPALVPVLMGAFAGAPVSEAQHGAHEAVLRLCDDTLAAQPFFGGGAFSISDIMMHTYLKLAARFAAPAFGRYERLQGFIDLVQSRDGYGRATAVTEPRENASAARLL